MRKILCLFILLNFLSSSIYSQPDEYIIKGVFLEKFTRFIDWPEVSDVSDSLKPFVIGIIGKDPFQAKLNNLYRDQRIKNKNVIVKQLNSIEQIKSCDLLFISRSEFYRFTRILKEIDSNPILTVSDGEIFSGRGAIINLKIVNNKIRFEIDESAAQKSGLHFSHLLLKEADLVNPLR